MDTIQNPSHSNKWHCTRCNTWCTLQARQCSWCGAGRPDTRQEATITESTSTPPEIRKQQEILNKIRSLVAKIAPENREELLSYIEKTYRV